MIQQESIETMMSIPIEWMIPLPLTFDTGERPLDQPKLVEDEQQTHLSFIINL